MAKNFWISLLLALGLFGCSTSQNNSKELKLPELVVFELDSLTSNSGNHYELYSENDKEVLYVLTPFNNRFVYFDFKTKSKIGEFQVEDDFENLKIGLAPPSGFYIHSLDSIFLYDYRKHVLYLWNQNGKASKVFEFMRNFPNDRSYWSGIYAESKPYFLDKDLISLGGSVESQKIIDNQNVDVVLNLKSFEVYRETYLPTSYLKDHYYSSVRLRPSRAVNKIKNVVYYSYYNSDSIYVRDLSKGNWTSFHSKVDGMKPFKDISDLTEFHEAESGGVNQLIYNATQGGHFSVFYDEKNNKIVRVSFLGIQDFDILRHQENPYKFNFVLSFYDPNSFENLGSYQIDQFDYRFMFFTKNFFYVINPEKNTLEDELVVSKYEYPRF
ncbi:hypothetical protein [Algoriphagus sp.]|uniref:hypothetical protein n=1 Tax=Algoriphagus sp. TaxID=1872435 RepID=UPI00391D8572